MNTPALLLGKPVVFFFPADSEINRVKGLFPVAVLQKIVLLQIFVFPLSVCRLYLRFPHLNLYAAFIIEDRGAAFLVQAEYLCKFLAAFGIGNLRSLMIEKNFIRLLDDTGAGMQLPLGKPIFSGPDSRHIGPLYAKGVHQLHRITGKTVNPILLLRYPALLLFHLQAEKDWIIGGLVAVFQDVHCPQFFPDCRPGGLQSVLRPPEPCPDALLVQTENLGILRFPFSVYLLLPLVVKDNFFRLDQVL